MISADLQAKLDTLVGGVKTSLDEKQAAYVAGKGKYFQLLPTPETVPADGAKIVPDKTRKPARQAESAQDIGLALPASMEASLRVDIYDGPDGKGYVTTSQVIVDGVLYVKRTANGPEKRRELDWVAAPDPFSVIKNK